MGKETAVIKIPKGFDIWQTLNCGQCFRFTKRDDGVICGVLQNRSLEFKVDGDSLNINCEQSFADKEIYHFFDFVFQSKSLHDHPSVHSPDLHNTVDAKDASFHYC